MTVTQALLGGQLRALLGDLVAQLTRLNILLENEQALLVDGQVEALLALAEDKTAAIRQIQSAENLRAVTLAHGGVANEKNALARFFAEQDAPLQELWQHYGTLARRAHELNQLNGQLIQQHMRHNQQALTILLAAAGPTLYGSDGQTANRPSGRLFGSA